MFFVLSKTVAFLLLPSNLIFSIGLLSILLMATRWRRVGARLALAGFVLLAVFGYLPVGKLLIHPLENRFPPWDASRAAPDGIVVLGGVLDPGLTHDRGTLAVGGAAARIFALGELARQFPAARIIFSSGSASLIAGGPAEADVLYRVLDVFGVPRQRVELERRARDTVENAIFSKAIAKPKPGERWLLVTSAAHMPRAVGCFRRVGFPVEAYPVDWTTFTRLRFGLSQTLSGGLGSTDFAVHEWLGLLAYWLTGRTSELLPGPAASP
jgi:uncharacterized SAM-binding protein YcdF (DUF218 family)